MANSAPHNNTNDHEDAAWEDGEWDDGQNVGYDNGDVIADDHGSSADDIITEEENLHEPLEEEVEEEEEEPVKKKGLPKSVVIGGIVVIAIAGAAAQTFLGGHHRERHAFNPPPLQTPKTVSPTSSGNPALNKQFDQTNPVQSIGSSQPQSVGVSDIPIPGMTSPPLQLPGSPVNEPQNTVQSQIAQQMASTKPVVPSTVPGLSSKVSPSSSSVASPAQAAQNKSTTDQVMNSSPSVINPQSSQLSSPSNTVADNASLQKISELTDRVNAMEAKLEQISKTDNQIEAHLSDLTGTVQTMNQTISSQGTSISKVFDQLTDNTAATGGDSLPNDSILANYSLLKISKTEDEIKLPSGKTMIVKMGHAIPGAGIAKATTQYMAEPTSNNGSEYLSWQLVTTTGRILP